jgi:hypothetical protein
MDHNNTTYQEALLKRLENKEQFYFEAYGGIGKVPSPDAYSIQMAMYMRVQRAFAHKKYRLLLIC